MAEVNKRRKCNEDIVYALVANIPKLYHASDLRNYFSQFLEQNGFECFHFRHRPEIVKCNDIKSGSSDTEGRIRNDKNSSSQPAQKDTCHEKTMCCVVKLPTNRFDELLKSYDRKCWLDRKGESIRSVCRISKIRVADVLDDDVRFKTRSEEKRIEDGRQVFTQKDLISLPELHPPALMPHGNVGTPTAYFLKQIQLCRLPATIISKLGLVFPRTRSNKQYGCVPFTYGGTKVHEGSANDYGDVTSSKGEEILSEECFARLSRQKRMVETSQGTIAGEVKQNEDDDSTADADDCEEWERHEAFHDDPSNQDRNAERLYESEMEIVWEKGGPGIVWYTDAQFWDELNGTEEEKDVDEWDIDMSVYYEDGAGDKDARDMMTMRREVRRRQGHCDSDSMIGKFETHTKGIGRKLLTKYGWKDGQGLGSSITGIVDALDDEGGQKPYDKRGLGYLGEKLQFFCGSSTCKRQRADIESDELVRISTIYDNPAKTDPVEQLLRRNEPTHMKHRSKHSNCSH